MEYLQLVAGKDVYNLVFDTKEDALDFVEYCDKAYQKVYPEAITTNNKLRDFVKSSLKRHKTQLLKAN